MNNKLGLNEEKLDFVEKKLINFKMDLLDEYFTFNENIFDVQYLNKLYYFLFSDVYFDYQLEKRGVSEERTKYVNTLLSELKNVCLDNSCETEKILYILYRIWRCQFFPDGNTRTLIAYLKILNDAFLLDLNVDVSMEIKSGSLIFEKENFVNQKQLTKK